MTVSGSLFFHLICAAMPGMSLQIFMLEAERKHWKQKRKEVLRYWQGKLKVFFVCFCLFIFSELVECKKSKLVVMQVRHKSDKQKWSSSTGSISFNFIFLLVGAIKAKLHYCVTWIQDKRELKRKVFFLASKGKGQTEQTATHGNIWLCMYSLFEKIIEILIMYLLWK